MKPLNSIRTLCNRYGLPYPLTRRARIDRSVALQTRRYNLWLAAIVLGFLVGATLLLLRAQGKRGARLPPPQQQSSLHEPDHG